MTSIDFRALFESAPGLFLVVEPGEPYRVVAASEAYLNATYTRREDVLGRGLFELFPDDPQDPQASGERNLRASLERVRRCGRADTMALQRYPIRRPEALGGGFEERYWSPQNAPVFASDGRLLHIIHRVEDVTAFVRLQERDAAREQLQARLQHMEADIVMRSQALERLNERLQTHVARLELLHRITRAVGERLELPVILRVVTERLAGDLALDFCASAVCEDNGQRITLSHVTPDAPAWREPLGLVPGASWAVEGAALCRAVQGSLVHEPDTAAPVLALPWPLAQAGLGSLVLAPLRVDRHALGLLVAARRQRQAFSSADCEFLVQLGEHVALAMRQAQLHDALKQAFDRLRHSQHAALQNERLRALGEMASGIAHDINNTLSPVTLYTEALLERERGLSEAGRAKLHTIQLAMEDVAHTVARMREFYRREDNPDARERVSLNVLVRQVLKLTQPRWRDLALREGAVIELRAALQEGLPEVLVSEADIREALVNLVFNAVDAMPRGGVLGLRTCAVPWPTRGGAVEVVVSDSGTGMDEETRQRCIEPFFTTKGRRGTGLGLALVYGAAQRHRGTLRIDSQPGRGTEVGLVLPVESTPAARRVPAAVAAHQPVPPLRLLLVDDDPLVLRSLQEALAADGHRVHPVASGQAAIDAFQAAHARNEAFDVVLTDLGMPHVDGNAVAIAVKAMRPATWVVMVTGWGRRMADEGMSLPDVDRLIAKPPRIDELRAALADGVAARPNDPRQENAT